jgi:hypothetical protein
MRPRIFVPFLFLLAAGPARAVIDAQGDGTQNLTAPADDFGWGNVGLVLDSQDGIFVGGVYLGNGWVLSAYHGVRDASQTGFQFGSVFFGGIGYTVDPATANRLHNPNSSLADLSLFRLTTQPPLPSLTIASSAPTNNLSVTLMGNGPNRETALTQWLVNPATDPDTWTEVGAGGTNQGYKWAPSQALRWGTNNIAQFGPGVTTLSANDGFGITTVFRTTFDNLPNEAQAGGGDSGGGVFWKVGGQWQLGGIMLFVDNLDGQPSGTAVFGDDTYAANLASYRNEIVNIVPEPSTMALASAGAIVLARRRRR